MDRIKQQVDQLQQQLAGLTLSQKMLTATLVAIMVATVVWWGHYAATGERVALLDQPLSAEQSGGIQRVLSARGIEFDVRGDRIFVRADRHQEAMGVLAYERQMPADTTDHFARAIGQMGSFDSRQRSDLLLRAAVQDTIVGAIRNMPGVRSATVILDQTYRRQMNGSVLPSASVQIVTTGSADASRLADAAGRLVAGSVAALDLRNVTVIVDGRMIPLNDASDPLIGGSRLLQIQAEAERHFASKIVEALNYIPGLTVSVSVEVNDTVSRRSSVTVDPDNRISAAVHEVNESEESFGGGAGAMEPGAISNTPGALASLGAAGRRTRESGETMNTVDYGRTRVEESRGAGFTRPTRCMLSVPMSWIMYEWRARHGTTSDPDPAILRQFETDKLAEIQKAVSHALGQLQPDDVVVMVRADTANILAGEGAMAAGILPGELPTGISGLIRDYGKEVAILALAIVSLFLVSNMVKKSAALAPAVPSGFEGQSLAMYGGEEMPGLAGEGESLLMAQEIDEDAMHAGQMLEQVQTLVRENPDAAAALVKRWLNAG